MYSLFSYEAFISDYKELRLFETLPSSLITRTFRFFHNFLVVSFIHVMVLVTISLFPSVAFTTFLKSSYSFYLSVHVFQQNIWALDWCLSRFSTSLLPLHRFAFLVCHDVKKCSITFIFLISFRNLRNWQEDYSERWRQTCLGKSTRSKLLSPHIIRDRLLEGEFSSWLEYQYFCGDSLQQSNL